MELRAFAICTQCSEIYPARRRCPACEGDEVAAAEVRAAQTFAASRTAIAGAPRSRARVPRGLLAATLSLTLLCGVLLLSLM